MAQLENGFTRLANEILEHIAKTKLNGSQFRIVMAIFRYTYGFNRKEHAMSISFLSEATELNERQVRRELKSLIDSNIVKVIEEATPLSSAVLSFNKYFDQWCLIRPEGTNQTGEDELDQGGEVYLDPSGEGELDPGGEVGLDPQERQLKDNIEDNPKEIYLWGIHPHEENAEADIPKKPKRTKKPNKFSEDAQEVAKHLKQAITDAGVTHFPRDWLLKNYAIAERLLKAIPKQELISCIDWAMKDDFWRVKINDLLSIEKAYMQFKRTRKAVKQGEFKPYTGEPLKKFKPYTGESLPKFQPYRG